MSSNKNKTLVSPATLRERLGGEKGVREKLLEFSQAGNVLALLAIIPAATKANIDARDKDGGWNALMMAASEGNTNIVKLLIKAGADVNVKDYDGDTALIYAASAGKPDVVKLLIKAGADISIKGWLNKSALDHAMLPGRKKEVVYTRNRYEIVKILKRAEKRVISLPTNALREVFGSDISSLSLSKSHRTRRGVPSSARVRTATSRQHG